MEKDSSVKAAWVTSGLGLVGVLIATFVGVFVRPWEPSNPGPGPTPAPPSASAPASPSAPAPPSASAALVTSPTPSPTPTPTSPGSESANLPFVILTPAQGKPGERFVAEGYDFIPGETLHLYIYDDSGTVTVNQYGSFQMQVDTGTWTCNSDGYYFQVKDDFGYELAREFYTIYGADSDC